MLLINLFKDHLRNVHKETHREKLDKKIKKDIAN